MKKNCPKIAKMLKKADPLQGFPSINRGLFKGATRGNMGMAIDGACAMAIVHVLWS